MQIILKERKRARGYASEVKDKNATIEELQESLKEKDESLQKKDGDSRRHLSRIEV